MKLATIQRMARQGDMSLDALHYLLQCRAECEWLDYKSTLSIGSDKELCDFGKDVLALRNVGGGYLVVGVEDKTWRQVGIPSRLPYDTKLLRDQIRKATSVDLDADLVHHDLLVDGVRRLFAMVLVRASNKRTKRRTPSLVGKDFCATKPFGLRRGEIYIRRGDSTRRVETREELDELLDRLEDDIAAADVADSPKAFAVEDGTYRLLEKGFQSLIGRDSLKQQLIDAVTHDPRIWIVNVHGPGGVGKSALVNWAAYEFYEKRTFEGIIHLTAKDAELTSSGIKPFGRSLYSLEDLLRHVLTAYDESVSDDLEKMREMATDVLSAWSTLLVLDNMETVADGRILDFVQRLPPSTRAKVVLTSRLKTGGWELPVPMKELNQEESVQFLKIKSAEMGVQFPLDDDIPERVWRASGGLPLALQWIIGRYKAHGNITGVVSSVAASSSPVLEFSFRNIWNVLTPKARDILSVLTIFDEPPTVHDLQVAMELTTDVLEQGLNELVDVTLVTRNLQPSDARVVYVALPITLSFARHQLKRMGDLETKSRQRMQRFKDQMTLQKFEVARFEGVFEQYGLATEIEKRAGILCRRGESEMFTGRVENAEALFRQARQLAPQSAYVLALSASFELARNSIGDALARAEEACARATKKTGALAYSIKARVLDAQFDKGGRVKALEKALEFSPDDPVILHQYGVALSRAGETTRAIDVFSDIIESERQRASPRDTLLMALKTRIINLKRVGRNEEATADLKAAKEILAKHPRLSHQVTDIAELEDET
jgi:tetratricopeptide (TPR) repeat protein